MNSVWNFHFKILYTKLHALVVHLSIQHQKTNGTLQQHHLLVLTQSRIYLSLEIHFVCTVQPTCMFSRPSMLDSAHCSSILHNHCNGVVISLFDWQWNNEWLYSSHTDALSFYITIIYCYCYYYIQGTNAYCLPLWSKQLIQNHL